MGVSVEELEALYRNGYAAFARVASAISGSDESGIESVQEAFAKAIRSRRTFRAGASLEAWVWRIVVNTARSRRVQESRHAAFVGEVSSNGSAPRAGEDADVRGSIAALPARQRETVFLRYFADLDYRSIALVLGVEVGTVSATLAAAHKALREAMEVPT